jgi:hypothetical protein
MMEFKLFKNLLAMKYYETEYHSRVFRIEEESPEVGAYLFVYENSKCVYDYLQNSVEDCVEFAAEEFSVPIDSWNEIVSN